MTVGSSQGGQYRRNITHVKRYMSEETPKELSKERSQEGNIVRDEGDGSKTMPSAECVVCGDTPMRPTRDRRPPKYLNDYVQ